MAMIMYQVDAFADQLFAGNPAAIIKCDAFPKDGLMQALAAENNLSETAFVVPKNSPGHFDLRWFTPTLEIEFCGHATIATAHTLAAEYDMEPPFHFHTQVGALIVTQEGELYVMDAPLSPPRMTEITPEIRAAFPMPLEAAFWGGDNLYIVCKHETDVRSAMPDMAKVRPLSHHGVGITARGSGDYDCVSRFFVPAQGIDEDPVTGSAHAAIGPYWADTLGRSELTAYQASKRGGALYLKVGETRLTIAGRAVTYMRGELRAKI